MPMRTRLFFCSGEGLLACLIVALFAAPSCAKQVAGEDLFQDCVIPNVHLILSPEATASLGQSPRRYVKGSVREGTKTYTNVAIRLKGGPGSFKRLDEEK